MSKFWAQRRVLVTGGNGFLGRYVCAELGRRGCEDVHAPRSSNYNLRNRDHVVAMYGAIHPHLVIHLAAVVGGIGANRANPARFFYENALMGLHVIHEGWYTGVPKMVVIGTTCSYPSQVGYGDAVLPSGEVSFRHSFKEQGIWDGYPEPSNAPYGLAKRMLLVQCQAYRAQYAFNAIYLIPANLYGPGDSLDPERSHVIPALIRKCIEARREGKDHITVWGSGRDSRYGRVTREFLYAADAARGIVLAAEKWDEPDPVNLGTGQDITIAALARTIAELTGFEGEIRWDARQPTGQQLRCLNVDRAARMGFRARVPLRDGLKLTIDWAEKALAEPVPVDAR